MAVLNLATIESHRNVDLANDDDIVLAGKIDDNCKVTLVSRRGSIHVTGKIDNNSDVTLIAAGDVRIGTEGAPGDRKIDNNCSVQVEAGGSIFLGDVVNNHCRIKFQAQATVSIGGKIDDNSKVVIEAGSDVSIGDKVDNNCSLEIRAVGDVSVGAVINNNCGVTIDTLRGGITIRNKIDDNCIVFLSAAKDILVGTTGGPSDRHINNRCHVFATSGGQIRVGDKLGDDCLIEFRACGPITIESVVERGCRAFFETPKGNDITVRKVRDSNTQVTYIGGRLIEREPRHESPAVRNRRWLDAPLFCGAREITGEWWQNWSWKYGYVTSQKFIPESLDDLVGYVAKLGPKHRTKAVGGGWSFTDASLPFETAQDADRVSMEKRGIGGKQPVRRLLEGAPDSYREFPFDHHPSTVVRNLDVFTTWSQDRLTNEVKSGFHLPAGAAETSIIDTRHLASSLQAGFPTIASSRAKAQVAAGRHFFHVEGGITMADLNVLLDHQKPRLAIQASGGSPGATLAGTLSTATHGGEFNWPLLVDRVKAIHLVGPGGVQWWIEGSESIADPAALKATYPQIDASHFVAGSWVRAECLEKYTAQDVLRAVTVAMGTVGVIYSVVLEVVAAYGIQQKVKRIERWADLLSSAGVKEYQLRNREEDANRRVLDFILDGARNGTGIPRIENVYVDLAVNPINQKCWIINRRVTGRLPRESKDLGLSIGQYEKSFRREMRNHSAGIFGHVNDELLARLMDFLNYGRSASDALNDIGQAGRLISFLLCKPPLLSTVLSMVNGQVVLNELHRTEPGRKRAFLGDLLTGLLNALMGTVGEDTSDITDLSYKVGAIGWTEEGLPGKGLEIALPVESAFSFLQAAILDRLALPSSPPLIGYVSVRVCPRTDTLLGMQQFGDFSVMIEPVGFRSPDSIDLFRQLLDTLAMWNRTFATGGMLHWGLENDLLDRARFENSAVTRSYRAGSSVTKLVVFKAIRAMLLGKYAPVFDNHFVRRLGLDDYQCALREVSATRKAAGKVLGLCNSGEAWAFVSDVQAVTDIRSRGIRYFIRVGGRRVFVHVINGADGQLLTTAPDDVDTNALLGLPDC